MNIKKIFNTWNYKDKADPSTFKSKRIIKTIYGEEEMGKQTRRFHFIHYVLKYKFIVPFIKLADGYIKKKGYSRTPEGPQFEYLRSFEESFHDAMTEWQFHYLSPITGEKLSKSQSREKVMKNKCNQLLQGLLDITKAVCLNDDAYLEFIQFLNYAIYKNTAKMLKDKEHNGRFYHLLHTVPSTMDPEYEAIYLKLRQIRNYEVVLSNPQSAKKEMKK